MTFVGLRNYFRILSRTICLPGLLKTFLFVGLEVPLQLVGALVIAQLLTRKLGWSTSRAASCTCRP